MATFGSANAGTAANNTQTSQTDDQGGNRKRKRDEKSEGGLKATLSVASQSISFMSGAFGSAEGNFAHWLELGPSPAALTQTGSGTDGPFRVPLRLGRARSTQSSSYISSSQSGANSGMVQRRFVSRSRPGPGIPSQGVRSAIPSSQQSATLVTQPNHYERMALARRYHRGQERRAQQRESRQKGIRMIRKYRTGELPDVAIKPSELIGPLQALALADPPIAQYLFSDVFLNLFFCIPEGDERSNAKKEITLFFQALMEKSKCDSTFIACLQRICFQESNGVEEKDIGLTMPAALVGDTAFKSLNFQTGIMLLEKQILKGSQKRVAKRRAGPKLENPQDAWLQLARLYKALGEEDILLGLYDKHISKNDFTRRALAAEIRGDYIEALSIYEEATEHAAAGKPWPESSTPTDQEVDLWETGRLECLVKLTKWEDLALNTLAEIEDEPARALTDQYCDPYLSYLLHSHSKLKQRWPDLWLFIDSVYAPTAPPAGRLKLELEYLSELAFIAITRGDFDRARYYINKYYGLFINKWAGLHPLALSGRHLQLQQLQRVVEQEEFLEFVRDSDDSNFVSPHRARVLMSTWRSRWPSTRYDNITVWDDVTTDRAILLETLNERFSAYWAKELEGIDVEDEAMQQGSMVIERSDGLKTMAAVKGLLLTEREEMYRTMAVGARKLNNFYVADHYMRLSVKAGRQAENNILIATAADSTRHRDKEFSFFHSLVKLFCLKAKSTHAPAESADKYVKALDFVVRKQQDDIIAKGTVEYQRKYSLLLGTIYEALGNLTASSPDTVTPKLATCCQDQLAKPAQENKPRVLQQRLVNNAYKAYTKAMQEADKELQGNNNASVSSPIQHYLPSASKAYLSLALFCDKRLKEAEDAELDEQKGKSLHATSQEPRAVISREHRNMYSSLVIENILKAMRLQLSRAGDQFPRLLELLQFIEHADRQRVFIDNAAQVPCWMFIRWISQMMAYVDKDEAPCVLPVLMEIGRAYPQALFFPFLISTAGKEQLLQSDEEDEDTATTSAGAPSLVQLAKILRNPLLEQFVGALEKLTHPEHRWKDWGEDLKLLVRQRDTRKIKALLATIREDVFNPAAPQIGVYNKRFASVWVKKFDDAFGADGSKLCRMKPADFERLCRDWNQQMGASLEPKKTASVKLVDFSSYLADFEHSDLSSPHHIELPGQYSGLCKPQPETHIRVSSYSPKLLVMGSMRKPKRLKIHGNDEKDYPYLVKGGEDLRLDQRVQQLFTLMNEIFVQNPQCSKRRLAIKTYQVVPMTPKVGIIEWLENTRPLKEIIEEEIARDSKKKASEVLITRMPAAVAHEHWLQGFSRHVKTKGAPILLYHAMYIHGTREDTIQKLAKQHALIKWDLLKRGIQALSKSPEAYLAIRSQFARTLAVFSVASYIIGIGDRHLENFLLDHKNGGLVGIDFGHAFGTATQFLPVPELIPFRLTRQLTNFLLPLDSEGLLKHNMVHTLSALQENKDILLNTMEVFVKDPLVDWVKLSSRLVREQEAGESASASGSEGSQGSQKPADPSVWFPREKIKIAEQKLSLHNPAFITWAELKGSTHAKADFLPSLKPIVRGDPAANVRAQVGPVCRDAQQQVECLVDQATDANILGRTYGGWAAWI
eukprot:TRINITY_DN10064_c0_g1_i1.p1 TRINITY_DN10064_c0_g1~~TRINITY_DN10064_c0_g1_i1.p1  ORF type:complete len:1634 (-),score=246.38 TRINITY_DN10064_c0_g1_i1:51-4931(-)